VLAGFYSQPLSFMFPPAFVREAQIRVAAEWKRADLLAVREIADAGLLPLDDLITHHAAAGDAERAYRTAFSDNQCLKMVIDWTGRA
jgi:3-hydroxyethyl bacteriochlorophyllide a dehydrogenase